MMKISTVLQSVKALANNERGATAIEYALIAALIAVAIIGAVTLVGGDVTSTFNSISSSLGGSS